MGWKYIMIESGMYRFPIIFPDKLVHAEVWQGLKAFIPKVKGVIKINSAKVVSAGVIEYLNVDGVGGSSETLQIESLGEEDEQLINFYNYGHGII